MNAYELSSQYLGGLVEEAKVVAKTRKTEKSTKAPVGKKTLREEARKSRKQKLFLESVELIDEDEDVILEADEAIEECDKKDKGVEEEVTIEEGENFNFEDAMQEVTSLLQAGDTEAANALLDEILDDTVEGEELEEEVEIEVEEEVEEEIEESKAYKRKKLREEARRNRASRGRKLREEAKKEARQELILESIEVVPAVDTLTEEEKRIIARKERRIKRQQRLKEESKVTSRKELIRKARRALRKK